MLGLALIVGRGHLEQILRVYAAHYNTHRPHRRWSCGRRIRRLACTSPASASQVRCAGATDSAGCSTSTTDELHERLSAPHGLRAADLVVVAFAVLLALGNGAILGASLWIGHTVHPTQAPLTGIGNVRVVDAKLWRGAAPGRDGYPMLAAASMTTVVDLRAEEYVHVDEPLLCSLGLRLVRIPIRDGQIPTGQQVDRFVATVRAAPGLVYVHCDAGVGRTGAMVAAYLAASRRAGPVDTRGCSRRNARQVVAVRRGAGSRPWRCSVARIAVAEPRTPRRTSSPWMRW